ncbi:MAG: hypothetical protein ACFFDW_10100 [Candidatus Thorarchaeota archaeon]
MNGEEQQNTPFLDFLAKVMKPGFLIIFIAISSIGIFVSTIYLFYIPGIISGIVFGFVLIVLLIVPLILILIYYFKVLRHAKSENDKKILPMTSNENMQFKSRIDSMD